MPARTAKVNTVKQNIKIPRLLAGDLFAPVCRAGGGCVYFFLTG